MILLSILFLFAILMLCYQKHINIIDYFYTSSPTPFPLMTPNSVTFIPSDILYKKLISNDDKFYDSLFDYDWKARKVSSLDNYKKFVKKSVSTFTEKEKEKIKTCTKQCDDFLMTVAILGFDSIKASNIPWNIGKIKGLLYEHGLPHTRHDDLIILSGEKNLTGDIRSLTRTLIHEKIHIYQKQNIDDVEKYLKINNFEKYKYREYNDIIRANPDLDGWIYKNRLSGNIYKCEYTSSNPENIMDVKNTGGQIYEHPYENMAVIISSMY